MTRIVDKRRARHDPTALLGRREWLGRLGASAALPLLPGEAFAQPRGQTRPPAPVAHRTRSQTALRLRAQAASVSAARRPAATTNGDEHRYPVLIGSYSKGLPHGPTGDVQKAAFDALVKAAVSGKPEDFDAIPTPGDVKLVNPLAAFAFVLEGADPHALSLPPPPRFDSPALAADACELYWLALARDVPFDTYATDAVVASACRELGSLSDHAGPRIGGEVAPACLFRGTTSGDLVGPYVSQYLLKEVPYGAIRLVPHVRTATPGLDYLVTWDDWLAVQNGAATVSRHAGTYRYIRSLRDLTAFVQLDFTYQAFLTACLVLFGMEGTTDVRRPYKGAPFDSAIPYRVSRTQSGFSTLGVAHALDLVARVANLALQHAWFHKWAVHRYLRPEEYSGRVHRRITAKADYPVHDSLLESSALKVTFDRHKSYLLPQAYPEGCPLHPSYPSGHATIAGACATVLKAFFDESFPIEEPVVPRADGLSLTPYLGPMLTVGGELDKLASNVALARSAAGIHWRSDNVAGLRLGEAIALDLLREMRACLPERFDGFALTTFDGRGMTV